MLLLWTKVLVVFWRNATAAHSAFTSVPPAMYTPPSSLPCVALPSSITLFEAHTVRPASGPPETSLPYTQVLLAPQCIQIPVPLDRPATPAVCAAYPLEMTVFLPM